MADKMYAWTNIVATGARPGDEVSVGDFEGDDAQAEFDELASIGAIRPDEYPIPADSGFEGSPREYYLMLAAQAGNPDMDLYSPPQGRDLVTQGAAEAAMEEAGVEPDVAQPEEASNDKAAKPAAASTASKSDK